MEKRTPLERTGFSMSRWLYVFELLVKELGYSMFWPMVLYTLQEGGMGRTRTCSDIITPKLRSLKVTLGGFGFWPRPLSVLLLVLKASIDHRSRLAMDLYLIRSQPFGLHMKFQATVRVPHTNLVGGLDWTSF